MDTIKTGILIKQMRESKGLSQLELAKELHVSDKTISKWECGNGFPDVSLLSMIAKFFSITIDELFEGKLKEKEYTTMLARSVKDGLRGIAQYARTKSDSLFRDDDDNLTFIEYLILFDQVDAFQFFVEYIHLGRMSGFNVHSSKYFIKCISEYNDMSKNEVNEIASRISGNGFFYDDLRQLFIRKIDNVLRMLLSRRQIDVIDQLYRTFKSEIDRLDVEYVPIAIQCGIPYNRAKKLNTHFPHAKYELDQLVNDPIYYNEMKTVLLKQIQSIRSAYESEIVQRKEANRPTSSTITPYQLINSIPKYDNLVNCAALETGDDDLVITLLEFNLYVFGVLRSNLDPSSYRIDMRNFQIYTYTDYFGKRGKKDLFDRGLLLSGYKEILSADFDFLKKTDFHFQMGDYIVYKFIMNKLTQEEKNTFRQYVLRALTITSTKTEIDNSSIMNYVFDNEDEEMYDVLKQYRAPILAPEQLNAEKEISKLAYQEYYRYVKEKRCDLDKIYEVVIRHRNVNEHFSKLANKYVSTEKSYDGMTYKEKIMSSIKSGEFPFVGKRPLMKLSSYSPDLFLEKIWKLENYNFFLKCVNDRSFQEIEEDIFQSQRVIGDIRKIRWVVENVTMQISNADALMLLSSTNQ